MTRNSPSAQPNPTPSAMNGKNDAICFEPGIARREGGGNRFVKNKCVTLRNNMGDNLPAVCFRKDRPVDAVYKQGGQGEEYRGVPYTLNTIDSHAVCYAIEGNVVDRNAGQNGKGWCEGVAPSLSTQDRHAVCFRKVSKPGADGKGERWEESEITNTLNGFEFHSQVRTPEIVCYAPNGNHCGAFLPADVAATLETKYHYGSGGDAVLVVEKRHE